MSKTCTFIIVVLNAIHRDDKKSKSCWYLEDESVEKEAYGREEDSEERQPHEIIVRRERFVLPIDRFHRFEETHLGKVSDFCFNRILKSAKPTSEGVDQID